jgi:thiaminase
MKKTSLENFSQPYLNEITKSVTSMDWSDRRNYANWLAQTYYYICHSTRILAAAASRFQVDRDKLHTQQANHIKEESHHERLAENDLKALGFSLKDFPELPGTKALYRSAYYMIEREHPISVYGYVFLLECVPVYCGGNALETVTKAFGASAARCLKLHTTDDPEHIKTYLNFIDELPESEKAYVQELLATTGDNYVRMMEEVVSTASKSAKKAA